MSVQGIGTFCWFELATTNCAEAKRFYEGLFGWKYESMPMPGGEYVIARQGDTVVGAMFELTKETGLGHMPPCWSAYVAVQSADAAAQRAEQLGGAVMKSAFDVMDMGRMAVLRDPTGAMFNVWQAKGPGPGASIDYRAKGHVCWVECQTRGTKRASEFYAALFGWRVEEKPDYIQFFAGEAPLGGFFELEGKPELKSIPPNWMLYFATDDVDASMREVEKLGGKVHTPPMELPNVGRFAVVSDPADAPFTLFRLNEDH